MTRPPPWATVRRYLSSAPALTTGHVVARVFLIVGSAAALSTDVVTSGEGVTGDDSSGTEARVCRE